MQEILNTPARRSFLASRVRNLTAVLAIALCSTLFTSITAIGTGTLQSMTLIRRSWRWEPCSWRCLFSAAIC